MAGQLQTSKLMPTLSAILAMVVADAEMGVFNQPPRIALPNWPEGTQLLAAMVRTALP